LTAPSTAADKNYGYVFNNCTIENNAAKYNLGRAWNNEPRCAYLNTTVNDNKINANRWTSNGMNVVAKEFVEYNTMDEQGTVVSPASNVVNFTYGSKSNQMETILTNEQAANFTLAKVFPTWAPNEMTLQLEAPDAEYADGTVTWTPANNGAIAYMIEKNGEFVGITAGNSMTVEADAEKDKLTIRAANGRGGFGEAKQVAYTATSIQAINAAIERGEQVIYNLAGQRVNKATKGMYIINGQKIVVK
jgi:pectin methylesterase-like acyl-CoA thioesterase